jgi:peptidyl-prolyl cis-trans isomerase C
MAVVHKLVVAAERPAHVPAAEHGPRTFWGRLRAWIIFCAREPFFHFIVLGLIVWSGLEYVQSLNTRYVIHIGPAQKQRLATAYQLQYGQDPTADQLASLVDRYVTEEIFLREGLALNLDKDDEIVRRRIAQKYEFLQTDLSVPQDPAPGVLERWFETNGSRYTTPARVVFTQVYFSADRDGDEGAQVRARKALEVLQQNHAARAPELGDSFPGPVEPGAVALDAAERIFGKSDLTDQLFKAPAGQWVGPYRSGFGWHLVKVTEQLAPQPARLDDVRARVLQDYLDDQRRTLNQRIFEKLRSKYKIERDGNES